MGGFLKKLLDFFKIGSNRREETVPTLVRPNKVPDEVSQGHRTVAGRGGH